MKKKVFIAPLNWGLGHATRDLPLIKELINKNFEVFVGANGRSLELLKREVPECRFIDFPDYPIKYPRTRFFVTRFMSVIFPQMLTAMFREGRALRDLQKKYKFDFIISDNRFRYLISHQLRYKLPFPINKMEWLPEYFNSVFFNRYDKIIVPDTGKENNFTGELAHRMRFIPEEKLIYSGILTDLSKPSIQKESDIDFLIIVSGPEPQRTKLELLIMQQIHALEGNVIAALGKPESNYKITKGNATIYSFLNRERIADCMSRAKFIIGRPGYTSVMEMVELGKKALFIPTPGQVEQVYLAQHYMAQGWCYCVQQSRLDLVKDVPKALSFSGFPSSVGGSKKNVQILIKNLFTAKNEGE
jgi:uncharacterized protein (TIGR00661 family)